MAGPEGRGSLRGPHSRFRRIECLTNPLQSLKLKPKLNLKLRLKAKLRRHLPPAWR